jgi:hypothetical protein
MGIPTNESWAPAEASMLSAACRPQDRSAGVSAT